MKKITISKANTWLHLIGAVAIGAHAVIKEDKALLATAMMIPLSMLWYLVAFLQDVIDRRNETIERLYDILRKEDDRKREG